METIIMLLLQPTGIAVFLILMAFFCLLLKPIRRYSVIPFSLSGVIILIFSTGTMASLLLSPLEYQFPSLIAVNKYPDVNKIVVLTGGATNDLSIPVSSRLNTSSAFRLLEALHIYTLCECDIYLSGGKTSVNVMSEYLLSVGIPGKNIFTDPDALHTYNSAENLSTLFRGEAFFLITSAGHMPRAMGALVKQGLNPIPVPTEFQMPKDFKNASSLPSPLHLFWSDLAVREYAGILWYKLTDKI